ncbi:MAG: hypothetical protein AAF657_34520 [Acidobacteriota bacterium]
MTTADDAAEVAKQQPRASDLPTASVLAQAHATLRGIEPTSEAEAKLKEGMRGVLRMIEQQYSRIDDLEDDIERLWLHFDFLVSHRLRVRGLRALADDLETQAGGRG